jgi:tripartite ATP-independent transporter DctP family solute receptor
MSVNNFFLSLFGEFIIKCMNIFNLNLSMLLHDTEVKWLMLKSLIIDIRIFTKKIKKWMFFKRREFIFMKKALSILAICLASVSLFASGSQEASADAHYNIIAACVNTVDHSFTKGMEAFKEAVEEKSNGRITVEIHANGELGGNEDELVQKLATGTVDVIIAAPAFMAQSVPEADLFSLPYLFADVDHWSRSVSGAPGKEIAEFVDAEGTFHFLGYFKDGVRNMYTTKPISNKADMKDIKFRIQNSPTQIAFWTALGVQPTFISFGEIYQALQNGVIDGAENSFASMAQQKHYEVCPYVTLTEHDVATRFFLMSEDKYNTLPADLQQIIDECGAIAAQKQQEIDLTIGDQYVEQMTAAGVTFSPIDKTPLIESTDQIRIDAAKNLGLSSVLDEINALR